MADTVHKQSYSAEEIVDPLDIPLSSPDGEDDTVYQVIIVEGSVYQGAHILVQGVPAVRVIDIGSDITIIGGNLFQKVAIAAQLCKRDVQTLDCTPRTFDQKPFHIDGKMEL